MSEDMMGPRREFDAEEFAEFRADPKNRVLVSDVCEAVGIQPTIRELDARNSDGFHIRLLWDSEKDEVLIAVEDDRTRTRTRYVVPDPADALEAFDHPFGYGGRRIR
jgi:hypothetical protein